MGKFCENLKYFKRYGDRKLNLGDICPFLFRDMGYFSKYLKGYGIPGTPFLGLDAIYKSFPTG